MFDQNTSHQAEQRIRKPASGTDESHASGSFVEREHHNDLDGDRADVGSEVRDSGGHPEAQKARAVLQTLPTFFRVCHASILFVDLTIAEVREPA